MIPGVPGGGIGIDGGQGGISGPSSSDQLSSGISSGDISSADRITKQFFNITGGSAGLDLNSLLGQSNNGFYAAIAGEQRAETAQKSDRWLPYVGLGVVAVLGLGFMLTRGR